MFTILKARVRGVLQWHLVFMGGLFIASPMLSARQHVIVFDLTNTLMMVKEKGTHSMQAAVEKIPGISVSGFMYVLTNLCLNPVEAAERDFRQLLQSFGQQSGPQEGMTRDQNNEVLPKILEDWLAGRCTTPQLIGRIQKRAKYKLFKQMAVTIFNSVTMARCTVPVSGAAACIERAIALVGKPFVFIIGNWEHTAFDQCVKAPRLQSLFAEIPPAQRLISGTTHLLMPRDARTFFELIAQRSGVSLEDIIFVSSMPYHLQAATGVGVQTIALCNHNFGSVATAITCQISK